MNSRDKQGSTSQPAFVDLRRLLPGDQAGLRAVWEVADAARRVDQPGMPPNPVEEMLNEPTELRSQLRERWLAWDSNEAVGTLQLTLPQLDNHRVAEVSIVVHPLARRRGIGRALFDVALRRAREEHRSILMTEVGDPVRPSGDPVQPNGEPGQPNGDPGGPSGEPGQPNGDPGRPSGEPVQPSGESAPDGASAGACFAAAVGAAPALAETCRVLDVGTLDEVRLDALVAETTSRCMGYDLVQWVGPASEHHVADLARLTASLSADAPMDDLEREGESWDEARVRESEARATAASQLWVTTAARHIESDRLVAYTDIGFSTLQSDTGHQWSTIVEGTHRGHRLGMLIKVHNLRFLKSTEPEVRRLFTWNADSNWHMLAINTAMGFQPVTRWVEWQLHLT